MNPEISRRSFLGLGGAAFARVSRENDDEARPWWAECPTSPDYRRLTQATAAEGLVVSVLEARTYALSFIDVDFPISTPVRLPARVRRDLQIVGTVRYEMSLSDAGAWGIDSGSDLVVTFQGPANVTVYADESNHGGVVIVATAPGPPGRTT